MWEYEQDLPTTKRVSVLVDASGNPKMGPSLNVGDPRVLRRGDSLLLSKLLLLLGLEGEYSDNAEAWKGFDDLGHILASERV